MKARLTLLVALLFLAAPIHAQKQPQGAEEPRTPVAEARGKIGDWAVIRGKVSQVKRSEKAVFINMGGQFPNHTFTAVIFKSDWKAFDLDAVDKLEGKMVDVTGKVSEYQGKPQIVLQLKNNLQEVKPADPPKP